jgi:TonB family protein
MCFYATVALGQQGGRLPTVLSASVPFYPRIAQAAHIEGKVQLKVSTDGNRAVSVEIQNGPAMLAKAAQENVKTWQFEQHAPTSFEVTFRYRLLASKCDEKCNCHSPETPSVVLQMPRDIEVTAEEAMLCDPAKRR